MDRLWFVLPPPKKKKLGNGPPMLAWSENYEYFVRVLTIFKKFM